MKNVQGFVVRNPLWIKFLLLGILEGEGQLLGARGLGLALGNDEPEGDISRHLLLVAHLKFGWKKFKNEIPIFSLFLKEITSFVNLPPSFYLYLGLLKNEINLGNFFGN
jgi:hypothetical protein